MKLNRYNPVPYHSRPLVTNLLSNFLLDSRGGSGKFLKTAGLPKTSPILPGDIVMTSHPLVFTTELTTAGIQESDINVPAMQYMVKNKQQYIAIYDSRSLL